MLAPAVADIRAQLTSLVRPSFVTATGAQRLLDLARYLQAINPSAGIRWMIEELRVSYFAQGLRTPYPISDHGSTRRSTS